MSGRMVCTQRFKYVVYSFGRHREQLFDRHNDPGEMVNLAVEARYARVLDEHRRLLWEWCHETGDRLDDHYSHPGHPSVPGYEYGA
jgi:choline-sulfatase